MSALTDFLGDIADAIREKTGEVGTISASQFAEKIRGIQGGGNIQESKDATPTESMQTITPDTGYDGLGQVRVGAISSTYVGSGVARRTSDSLSVSGATVSAPSGYYQGSAQKSIPNGSMTLSVSVDSNGLVTATVTNFSAGYFGAAPNNATYQIKSGDLGGKLIASNIKTGVTMVTGLTGNYEAKAVFK